MRLRRSGTDVALIGYGAPTNDCLAAAELLQQVGAWGLGGSGGGVWCAL